MTGPPESSNSAFAMLSALESAPRLEDGKSNELDPTQLESVLRVGSQNAASRLQQVRATLLNDLIKSCVECGGALNLPAARVGRPTETWRCQKCHAVFITGVTGADLDRLGVAQRAHRSERLPLGQFSTSQPTQLRRLVKMLTAAGYLDDERRAKPRYPVSLPALGVPISDDRLVAGPPIRLTTRDVSLDGLSAFSETPLPSPLMLIDFTLGGLVGWQVSVRVVRQKTTGFLHEFGAEFIGE